MNGTLPRDAAIRPDLFLWNGAPEPERLAGWVANRGWRIPEDLLRFWMTTGGGEVFETEIVLPPMPSDSVWDDVATTTDGYRTQGLSTKYLVFHRGLGISALDQKTWMFVHFTDARFVGGNAYESFDAWYVGALRAEYAERYRLGSLPP